MDSLNHSIKKTEPFDHWIFNEVFSDNTAKELAELEIEQPKNQLHNGKRETNNSTRFFLNKENCIKYPILKSVVNVFQNRDNIIKLKNISGSNLEEGKLRIEYTMDEGNFWLEPHLDIKEKLLTFLVYLADGPGSDKWGTTLYNPDLTFHSQAPYRRNFGFMFVAGQDTWHGVPKQKFEGVRKNLIINYVTSDWQSVGELAPKFD
jgi:hypothetical protein